MEDEHHIGYSGKLESMKPNEQQASNFLSKDEFPHVGSSRNDYPSAESKALVPVTPSKDDTVGRQASAEGVDGEASPGSTGSLAGGSLNRDLVLAKLNQDKSLSLIRAWEENMKAKSLNRYNRKVSKISAWESARKAKAEATLRSLEEKLEKKKAAYVEKMKNEIASVHRNAEEERALAEAHHGEEILKAEESAAKCRASGKVPRRLPFCLGY